MRILALRGRNLASLDGDFEVSFDAPPLRDVGIFAIAGPTGAGKSTLLDALCLALYDRTPRLDGNSGVKIGRADEDVKERLGDQDTRALLRRGAAEGKAEVDFVGRDGRRYRATWSVRRARGAAGGRLQQVEMAFTDLDAGTTRTAGTKTETLAAIAATVGLPFDQFRRSVLLAQGDFAAFLQANANERADLLERMTGTGLYARLSIAAFERARKENEALAVLETRIGEARPLADDERAALEAERAAAQGDVERVRVDLAAAQGAVAWHLRHTQLAAALSKAAAGAAAADGAWLTLGPRESLRTPAGLAAAAKALDDLRTLDQQVALARAKATNARGPAAQAQEAATRAAATAARLAQELATLCGRLETTEAWIAARAALQPVAEAWGDLRPALEDARKARARADQAATDLATVRAEQARTAPAIEAADDTLRRASDAASAAEQALADARRAATIVDATAARAALDAAVAAERALAAMADAADVVVARSDAAARERADAATARGEARTHDDRARAAAASQAVLAARLDEVRAVRERALAARDLAGHRAALVAGEPCPLCGATAHPFAAETPAFDATLADLGARVADLERDRTRAERTATSEAADARAAERRAVEAEGRAAAADRDAAAARVRWTQSRVDAPDGDAPSTAHDAAAHVRAVAAARTRIEAARAREAQATEAQREITRRADAVGTALKTVDRAKDVVAKLAADAKGREARAAELERTRADAQRDADAALAALEVPLTPLGAWRAAFDRDAAAFLRTTDVEVRAFAERLHGLATDRAGRPALERSAADGKLLATKAEDDAALARTTAAAADDAAAALDRARAERFAGWPTSEVEKTFADARDAHRAAEARAADLATHEAVGRPPLEAADATARAADLETRRTALDRRLGELTEKLTADDRVRTGLASLQRELETARAGARTWQDLSTLIGSADGKKLRVFAQSLTLEELVGAANAHLAGLRPRYRLARVPDTDLDLQVVDRDLGDEVRAVASLSGGETFLVSLALALGLSSLSAHDVRLDSLFVDEGFGTLDPDTLESALAVLDELQAEGRQVGLISHVPGLAERLGARVEVRPVGVGTSRVRVVAG